MALYRSGKEENPKEKSLRVFMSGRYRTRICDLNDVNDRAEQIPRCKTLGKSHSSKQVTTVVTTESKLSNKEHLEAALHHLALAGENKLAKQVKLRLIELG